MPEALAGVALVVASFLVGAVPWGYLLGQRSRGIDLRQVGSGGTGATNVLRTLGRGAAITVLVLDVLKGVLPIVIGRIAGFSAEWIAAAGVAAVAGHCWSPFIGFKGGKGMATGAGAALALFPPAVIAVPIFVGVVWRTRFVSLGSLIATTVASLLALLVAAMGQLPWSTAIAILAIAGIIIGRHRQNIDRLRQGTERRFGERIAT